MHESTDFSLIRDSVARYADERILPDREALDLVGLRELGLLDLDVSDASGIATLCLVLETLAARSAAPAALLFAHHLARETLRNAEANGHRDLFAFPAFTELEAEHGLRASGERLEGISSLVVGAPIAEALLLPALDESGELGLALVRRGDPGVGIGEPLLTLGMRGCPTADVSVSIDKPRLLPAASLRRSYARFRGPAVAIAAGLVGASLRTALDYAKERYQGGKQIIDHDEVRLLLAGMSEDHAHCRLAADRLRAGELSEAESLALFTRAKQRAARATADGVQLLGGNGYMEDYDQERCMRDARQAECLLGRVAWSRLALVAALANPEVSP
jgi:alkylation response protein AidB-like acyl-CoA dehydrogenase